MMIEDGDLFYLRQKTLINLLYIGPGQGTSLTKRSPVQPPDQEHTPPNLLTHEIPQIAERTTPLNQ